MITQLYIGKHNDNNTHLWLFSSLGLPFLHPCHSFFLACCRVCFSLGFLSRTPPSNPWSHTFSAISLTIGFIRLWKKNSMLSADFQFPLHATWKFLLHIGNTHKHRPLQWNKKWYSKFEAIRIVPRRCSSCYLCCTMRYFFYTGKYGRTTNSYRVGTEKIKRGIPNIKFNISNVISTFDKSFLIIRFENSYKKFIWKVGTVIKSRTTELKN